MRIFMDDTDKRELEQKIDAYNVKSSSGSTIVLNDSADFNFMGMKMYGKTKQKKYSGKNLLKNTATSQSVNGGTFTVNKDGSITINGTFTANSSLNLIGGLDNYELHLEAGEYILSGISGGSNTTYFLQVRSETILDFVKGTSTEVTFKHDGSPLRVYLYIAGGATVNETIYPMIRKTEIVDPTYEPYVGGQPSPNPEYDQKLESVGKWGNLLENVAVSQTIEGITYTVNKDKSVTANGTAIGDSIFVINYKNAGMTLNPNQYKLSGCPSGSDGTYMLHYWGNVTGMVQDFGNGKSFELTGADTDYNVSIVIPSGITINATFYPMIVEADSGITEYRPYTGQREIESGVYGGNLAVFYKNFENRGANTYTTYQEDAVIGTCATTGDNFVAVYELDAIEGEVYTISADAKKNISWIHTYTDTLWGTPYKNYYLNNLDGICVTFEAQNTQKYVIGFYGIQGKDFEIKNPRINKGTEALPYTPYTKQSHTNLVGEHGLGGLPLGKTIPEQIANSPIHMAGVWWCAEEEQYYISDTVNNESGELVNRIGTRVFDGSEDEEWTVYFEDNHIYRCGSVRDIEAYGNARDIPRLLCDSYISVAQIEKWANYDYMISRSIDSTLLFVRNKNVSTIAEFGNLLAENPITVQYILATPIVKKLTDTEIASYKALHTNNPNTTVMNDCGAYMKARYLESKYDDGVMEVVEKVVESKLEAFFAKYMNEIAELQGGDA